MLQNCYKTIKKGRADSPKKTSVGIMNLKRLVTVIVAGFALCLMFNVSCEAAATTKATTKEKSSNKYTESELRYMSSIIYCEARGESYAGQKAVGIVVMNRVRSKSFPDSVKEVIYQRGQFSPVRNGTLNKALKIYDQQKKKGKFKSEMKSCRKAAKEVLEGSTTIKVRGKKKEMKSYLFFSRYIAKARYQLGSHQFK